MPLHVEQFVSGERLADIKADLGKVQLKPGVLPVSFAIDGAWSILYVPKRHKSLRAIQFAAFHVATCLEGRVSCLSVTAVMMRLRMNRQCSSSRRQPGAMRQACEIPNSSTYDITAELTLYLLRLLW